MGEMIQIRKDQLYICTIGLLLVLLAMSIASGGFGAILASSLNLTSSNPGSFLETRGVALEPLMAQGARIGSDNAPIVMVEFSDFQCPYCRTFWQEALPDIKKNYIDTGKVQLIYRNYPLDFHPGARPAALAAECAHEQGRWQTMHDVLFSQQAAQGQGTIPFSVSDLKSWARQIPGLNTARFDQCMDSGKYNAKIEQDLQAGLQAGVSGTPAFFIGKRGGKGRLVVGAQPYSSFQKILEELG